LGFGRFIAAITDSRFGFARSAGLLFVRTTSLRIAKFGNKEGNKNKNNTFYIVLVRAMMDGYFTKRNVQ
jgi:hypothetical protein